MSLEITLEEPKPVDHQDTPRALDGVFSDIQEPGGERTLTPPESGSSIDLEVAQEQQQPAPPISIPILSAARCWTGIQADVNVMMPDRSVLWWPYCVLFALLHSLTLSDSRSATSPMDLQFTVDSPADLTASQQPPELREYLRELEALCVPIRAPVSLPTN